MTRCLQRRIVVRSIWRSQCLTSGGRSLGVDKTDIVRIGTGLESSVDHTGRSERVHLVILGIGTRFRGMGVGELSANISHHGLGPRMDKFGVVLIKNLLVNHHGIFGLLSERGREE
jgi:hypothetical protein